jgi:predicted ArsR family transcriptional regulator
MARQTKTLTQRITSAVSRGPKKGLTAAQIAAKLDANPSTVGVYLNALKGQGIVKVAGKVETGKRGRPALLYVAR